MGEFRYVGTQRLKTMARGACREAVRESARELKAAVIADTPVDTGDLEGTTRIIGPRTQGDTVTARVAQGGPDAPYAVIVHQKWSHRGPARQVAVPLIRHRFRHIELLAVAGRKVFGR